MSVVQQVAQLFRGRFLRREVASLDQTAAHVGGLDLSDVEWVVPLPDRAGGVPQNQRGTRDAPAAAVGLVVGRVQGGGPAVLLADGMHGVELLKLIRAIHEEFRSSYGSPRVHAELTLGLGEPVNRKRVEADAPGRHPGDPPASRRNQAHQATEEDLVGRDFTVDAPHQLWVTDVTEHPTKDGKLYCAAVLDCFSSRIIGHSIDIRQTSTLVIDAMAAAVARRNLTTDATILHSDHGFQYTSWAFGRRLREAELLGSMVTVGDCFDNAMMESFWGTMQTELLDVKK
ncbi:hypothetical protein GCM10010191_61720 [Actinomadura vinacea]|uniref:Integrase catalytic domain-containing protein n=2 Tax=Actinomadura vinacea TaxID=115336 RepID=A0ABN3JRG7_9ACTN